MQRVAILGIVTADRKMETGGVIIRDQHFLNSGKPHLAAVFSLAVQLSSAFIAIAVAWTRLLNHGHTHKTNR